MANTVTVTLAILIGFWILVITIYKVIIKQGITRFVKNKNKRKIRISLITFGIILNVIFSFWILVGFGGSLILHVLNDFEYNALLEYKRLTNQDGFVRNKDKPDYKVVPENFLDMDNEENPKEGTVLKVWSSYKNKKLIVKDTDDNNLQYYVYTENIPSYNLETATKMVIIHHGINGSRYRSLPFIKNFRETTYLSNKNDVFYLSYDSLGWNDSVERGEPTFGIKEAHDLYKVMVDAKKRFLSVKEVIFYGFSMGGATILNMIQEYKKQLETLNQKEGFQIKFIVDSSYYNLQEELIYFSKKLVSLGNILNMALPLVAWLYGLDTHINFNFNALENSSSINIEMMIIHAKNDRTVSFNFSCNLNKARNQNNLDNKTFAWFVDQSEHAVINERFSDDFESNVDDFLDGSYPSKQKDINVGGCT